MATQYHSFFKPNTRITYVANDSTATRINPLTGKVEKDTTQGATSIEFLDCMLELVTDTRSSNANKEGVPSGGVLLEGRVISQSTSLITLPSWFVSYNTYECSSALLGEGKFFAMPQIESVIDAHVKYFGYPIFGFFLRLG